MLSDRKGKFRPLVDGLATEETLLSIAGLIPDAYDSIELNFTDSTKETIDNVVYKNGATTVATITLTQTATKDTYTKT